TRAATAIAVGQPGRAHVGHARARADLPGAQRQEPRLAGAGERYGGQVIPRSLSLAAATAAIVAAAPLRAQSGVNLKTTVTGEQVEAGENFELRLSALSDAGTPMPSSPRLSVPAGVTAHGPSVGTNQQVSIVNGRVEQRQGITASWVLSIEKPGTYRIGPASVEVNGARVNGEVDAGRADADRKSTGLNSSPGKSSYAVRCLKTNSVG